LNALQQNAEALDRTNTSQEATMRVEQSLGTKGSLRWIQRVIEYDSELLAHRLRDEGTLSADETVNWVSPRAADEWAEYRDEAFLEQLALGHLADALREYWPSNGPQWDALGRTSDGRILLVEAKAHVGELASTCGAVSTSSRALIAHALNSTRAALGADPSSDWMAPYYQYANRLAHLQLLRTHGVDATLVFVYFTDDEDMPTPRDHAGFERAIRQVHLALGFPEGHAIPHVVDLFVGVAEIAGSAARPEQHRLGYDFRKRFPEQRVARTFEGGIVFAASGSEGYAVINDESTMVDMLGEDDVPAVYIRIFSTSGARDAYLREQGWE
jgi:hypothetical protein